MMWASGPDSVVDPDRGKQTSSWTVTDSGTIVPFSFLRDLGQDLVIQASAPFTMSLHQSEMTVAGVAITVGLVHLDPQIDRYFNPLDRKNRYVRMSSPRITELGGKYGIEATAAFGAYSLLSGDDHAQRTSVVMSEALITSGLWVRLGKVMFSRERPNASVQFSHRPGGEWRYITGFFRTRFQTVGQYDAFPSGHTATAFSLAAVIDASYGPDRPAVGIAAYALATGVGLTRMVEHEHWASDVFAGAVIGYLCGHQVAEHSGLFTASESERTHLSLAVIGRSPGVQLSLRL